ncbi:MAG: type III-B CRISPR module RAMP protein Cmr4 [Deltaproteobacteria bacterium]|jgi:CRISPR-associated protein Cmr4|nr:type III-B CRISPR module RAMP protein Cmr4 [Deltaproteobacteria bacterium]
MHKKEIVSIASLYAISPVHAGSGMSTGAVDLPIQRERHTNWPHVQASAVKGAMRAHFRNYAQKDIESINQIFGSDKQDKDYPGFDQDIPGSISVSDAKLLVFPVRSNIAPFITVTCPAVLKRLQNDLLMAGFSEEINHPVIKNNDDAILLNWQCKEKKIIMEDAVVQVAEETVQVPFLADNFKDIERLVLVSDKLFGHIVSTCTEIQTQIKIDHEKGTAQPGALRYEELLPSDTLLYIVVHHSRHNNKIQASMIKNFIETNIRDFMQIGGDETLGRGVCKLRWLIGKEGGS